jgi:hypothetical protein
LSHATKAVQAKIVAAILAMPFFTRMLLSADA